MKSKANPVWKKKWQFACSTWLARVKAWAMILLIAAGVAVLIGGCVRIDYGVFKAKYPNADKVDYIWSKLFHK